jgi:hypothetical protein
MTNRSSLLCPLYFLGGVSKQVFPMCACNFSEKHYIHHTQAISPNSKKSQVSKERTGKGCKRESVQSHLESSGKLLS